MIAGSSVRRSRIAASRAIATAGPRNNASTRSTHASIKTPTARTATKSTRCTSQDLFSSHHDDGRRSPYSRICSLQTPMNQKGPKNPKKEKTENTTSTTRDPGSIARSTGRTPIRPRYRRQRSESNRAMMPARGTNPSTTAISRERRSAALTSRSSAISRNTSATWAGLNHVSPSLTARIAAMASPGSRSTSTKPAAPARTARETSSTGGGSGVSQHLGTWLEPLHLLYCGEGCLARQPRVDDDDVWSRLAERVGERVQPPHQADDRNVRRFIEPQILTAQRMPRHHQHTDRAVGIVHRLPPS
jgi:hypothetical protein